MAFIVDGTSDGIISVEDFVEDAKRINLDDEAEILTLAPRLRELSNNKNFLVDFINKGLLDVANFQRDNLYSSQTYIIGDVSEKCFIRFALWAPLNFGPQMGESDFYSYDTAHNHDFSLLTAGMLGSGYTTSIYQLLPDQSPIGYINEDIRLTEPQVVQLTPGRVILYEAGKDIHVQHPAQELSISLNLMVNQSEKYPQQFFYDVAKSKISGYVAQSKMKRGTLFRYASILNDTKCNEMMAEISQNHPCELTRLYAFRAIAAATNKADAVQEEMMKDASQIVRSSAHVIASGFSKLHIWG
jgi:hypothetical protein